MRYVEAKKCEVIPIGRQGENEVEIVQFDVSGWAEEYGDGVFTLLHQRSRDTSPYECPIEVDGETVNWTVRNTDTAYGGLGEAQLIYTVDEAVAKSVIFETKTYNSLDGNAVFPDPYDDWLRQIHEDTEFTRENMDKVVQAEEYAEIAEEKAKEASAFVGSPLTASLENKMTNHDKVYVYVGNEVGMNNGDWYYWNGTAWVDGGVYNSVAVETDTTLSFAGKAADAKATGEVKSDFRNAVFGGKIVYQKWYQGARATSSIDTITQNANRCTSDVFRLEVGDYYKISGVPEGYKFAIAGIKDAGSTFDSGWLTIEDKGYINEHKGSYFVNVATQSGSTALTPSDISDMYIEINGDRFYFSSNERENETEEKINKLHNLVNYDYRYNATLPGKATGTGSGRFEIHQNGTELTITDADYPNGINEEVFVRLNNIARNSGYYSFTKTGTFFKPSRTYRVTLEFISGQTNLSNYIPSISIYKTNSTRSEGAYWYEGDNKFCREFTTVSDLSNIYYDIVFYISAGKSFNNAKYRILLEDVTDEPQFDTEKINTIISDGYFQIGTPADMVLGTFSEENGYYYDERFHYKKIYLKAYKGDRIKYFSESNEGLIAVTDDPVNSHHVLYSSGYGYSWDIVNEYDGYYVLLAKAASNRDFSGTWTIYPNLCKKYSDAVFDSEVDTTVNSVRALQTEPSIVFPLITDLHYGVSQNGDPFLFKNKTIFNMQRVFEKIRIDAVVCLGDLTDGNNSSTADYAININNNLRSFGVPYLLAIGNHDDNRYGTTFSAADMYAYYSAFADNKAVFNADTDGRDYYIDLPNYKTRFIVLDSNTIGSYGFPQACVDWFEDVALNTPENYLAVVLTHISPVSSQNYDNTSVTNGDAIAAAITAYQTGGKPIVQFYGHSHCDVAFTTPYLSIGTNCAKFENTNGDQSKWPSGAVKPSRVMGEVSEDCWDMVVIRPLSRKVDCVRFGAGSDRSFTY